MPQERGYPHGLNTSSAIRNPRITHACRGRSYKIVVHRSDLTHRCVLFGHTKFANIFQMYCHHLKIRFHVKIQISSLHSYLTTITWRCCLSLLTFPRCPLAHSVSQATYTAAWSTADLKELQTVTLEWPPESSVCKPLANASSFSCHCASDSSCSLLPVLSPSF